MSTQAVRYLTPLDNETLKSGVQIVSSAGTAQPLSDDSVPCYEVSIQPLPTNIGTIYIGGADIHNDLSTGGNYLTASGSGIQPASLSISAQNLNQIYIDADNDGEGVTFIYW